MIPYHDSMDPVDKELFEVNNVKTPLESEYLFKVTNKNNQLIC